MEWKFKKLTRSDTKRGATQLEFFSGGDIGNWVDALIREDIQNHLDAKKDEWPITVTYSLGCLRQRKAINRWFGGLMRHMQASEVQEELRNELRELPAELPYLLIEDFGTTGLRGDPAETTDKTRGRERNDFYWFVRNVGRSSKKRVIEVGGA